VRTGDDGDGSVDVGEVLSGVVVDQGPNDRRLAHPGGTHYGHQHRRRLLGSAVDQRRVLLLLLLIQATARAPRGAGNRPQGKRLRGRQRERAEGSGGGRKKHSTEWWRRLREALIICGRGGATLGLRCWAAAGPAGWLGCLPSRFAFFLLALGPALGLR